MSTYFRGGGWRVLLLLVISAQENGGFLCSSDVQRDPRNPQQAGLYLDDRSPRIPRFRLYSTIDSSVSARCCVTMYDGPARASLTSGGQKCAPVQAFFTCVGSGMSACSKTDFIWDGTFASFDPKDVLTSKFDFHFQKSRRKNLYYPPNKLCSLFLFFFWSTVYPFLNDIQNWYIFYRKMSPFKIHISGLICA